MRAPTPRPEDAYLEFIRAQVATIRPDRAVIPPATERGWSDRLRAVADGLRRSFGSVPAALPGLDPDVLGTIRRDGYAIDRLTYQGRPGVRVTANLYRPEPAAGRLPAVLSVHGHWPWARIDPVVQARCVGLAKLGYLVLAVDAFGAGERAIDPGPGTYHGALDAATLWPAGVPLLGLQVYDNRRAIDYLISRPDVDPARLAITGASGGGNQSLYAGATDDRIAAVVPVCGVGTYESYLGVACCACEVNVAGLTYATTGDLLAMIAPRPLLVISATRDVVQFSVAEAARSVAHARSRYALLGAESRLRHLAIEGGHGYDRPMREALYGWLDLWLRGRGDGRPVPEPEITTEDPRILRCYPDGPSRPKSIMTLPAFAVREGRERLERLPAPPDHPERWEAEAVHLRAALRDRIGPIPAARTVSASGGVRTIATEPGLTLAGLDPADRAGDRVLLIRPDGLDAPGELIAAALTAIGKVVCPVDLRAIGRGKPATSPVRGVADHDAAEWGLWIGRPLLWQWVRDALAWIDSLDATEVVGVGPFGLVGLIAAASRPDRIERVGLFGTLASFVGPDATPAAGLPMGLLAPGLLEIGDVGHWAGLIAPRPLAIAAPVELSGRPASPDRAAETLAFPRAVYRALDAPARLTLIETPDPVRFVRTFAG